MLNETGMRSVILHQKGNIFFVVEKLLEGWLGE